MSFQVTLDVTDCATQAVVPYPSVTDGVGTLTGDSFGHVVVTILGNYVGYNVQLSAANYQSQLVQLAATDNGKTRAVCLNHITTTPTPSGGGW